MIRRPRRSPLFPSTPLFRSPPPKGKQDSGGSRARLAADVFQKGMAAWQEGKDDSAVVLLRRAAHIDPASPQPLYQLGTVFANRHDLDSATAYLRQAVAASAGDTAYPEARRDAPVT